MICVNKENVVIDGLSPLVATELAMIIHELTKDDKQIVPAALATVYSDGGDASLDDALARFKEDTSLILKHLESIEKRKR